MEARGFDYTTYTGLGKQTLGGHKQKLVCTKNQKKGAVSLQETDPDLPVNVQDITRWSIPKSDGLYPLEAKIKKSTQSVKTRPGADCGSDHELLIAKFRLTLKKVGKATRPFMYDLNQTPYNYTVEVTNRFKGLDLLECLKNCERRFVMGGSNHDHPQEKEIQKSKIVV